MKHAINIFIPFVALTCIDSAPQALVQSNVQPVRGAFTCDFGLSSSMPMDKVAPTIERDRMYMAAQPGFVRKAVPLSVNFQSGVMTSGGRYLFVDEADAESYETFVRTEFALDGVPFLDRPIFVDPQCFSWRVVEYEDFGPVEAQTIERVERFAGVSATDFEAMHAQWSAMREDAIARGLTGLWLLYDEDAQLAALIYYAKRVAPSDVVDVPGFDKVASHTALGDRFSSVGFTRVFDRTSFVLSSWSPFVLGDRGVESLWPNSPALLPPPSCGDAVCETSRGEEATSCSVDCPALCGDARCQPEVGETTLNCPGDCRDDDRTTPQELALLL